MLPSSLAVSADAPSGVAAPLSPDDLTSLVPLPNASKTNGHSVPANGHPVNGSSHGTSPNGHTVNSTNPTPAAVTTPESAGFRRTSKRVNTLLGVQVLGTGSYVPAVVVSNEELLARYGFDPEWIVQRTGIHNRRHCSPEQATSDLCVEAGRKAIRASRLNPSDIDLLVVGTFTSDYACPSTACLVQDRLGLDCATLEIQSACAGFMYAMTTAAQYVATGNSKNALVIGGDCNSRIVNPRDQRTYPLFGDGAGAVVLTQGDPHQGLLAYQLGADGGGGSLLDRPASGTRHQVTAADLEEGRHLLRMDGRVVFKWAVRTVADTIELLLKHTGLDVGDVALYVLHQGNIRIIQSAAEQLGIAEDKLFTNLQNYGNTSAGSIPLALDEAIQAGRVRRGDTVLMCGFGAGLSWGTALFRW